MVCGPLASTFVLLAPHVPDGPPPIVCSLPETAGPQALPISCRIIASRILKDASAKPSFSETHGGLLVHLPLSTFAQRSFTKSIPRIGVQRGEKASVMEISTEGECDS
jgi:hypothetical protein